MVATASPALKKATARVLKLSKDERARMLHEAELKAWRDEQARLGDARTEERVTFARNLLKRNRPIAEIAEDTGLSHDEIKKFMH
jgi:DNA-binding phage protein